MSKEENILLEEISKQKKQIELLQFQCRKAGKSLVDQEVKIATLIKDLDQALLQLTEWRPYTLFQKT